MTRSNFILKIPSTVSTPRRTWICESNTPNSIKWLWCWAFLKTVRAILRTCFLVSRASLPRLRRSSSSIPSIADLCSIQFLFIIYNALTAFSWAKEVQMPMNPASKKQTVPSRWMSCERHYWVTVPSESELSPIAVALSSAFGFPAQL